MVVDPYSAPYLQGATIDFLTALTESGFKIDNPNASASCGCGHSFTVEEGAADAASGARRRRLRLRLLALSLYPLESRP